MRFFRRTPPRGQDQIPAAQQGLPLDCPPGLMALAEVLHQYGPDRLLARPAEMPAERELRKAARLLAQEARARDPRAEQLLIELKRSWTELPAVRAVPAPAVRDALWRRLVAVCVEEFYTPTKDN